MKENYLHNKINELNTTLLLLLKDNEILKKEILILKNDRDSLFSKETIENVKYIKNSKEEILKIADKNFNKSIEFQKDFTIKLVKNNSNQLIKELLQHIDNQFKNYSEILMKVCFNDEQQKRYKKYLRLEK